MADFDRSTGGDVWHGGFNVLTRVHRERYSLRLVFRRQSVSRKRLQLDLDGAYNNRERFHR